MSVDLTSKRLAEKRIKAHEVTDTTAECRFVEALLSALSAPFRPRRMKIELVFALRGTEAVLAQVCGTAPHWGLQSGRSRLALRPLDFDFS